MTLEGEAIRRVSLFLSVHLHPRAKTVWRQRQVFPPFRSSSAESDIRLGPDRFPALSYYTFMHLKDGCKSHSLEKMSIATASPYER